jgi:hypothetical protein
MSDPMTTSESRCPWCSAALSEATVDKCPSCGAQLIHASGAEPNLPGVTALDAEAILRARSEAGRNRGGLLGFLTGRDLPEVTGTESPESLAPPQDAVRREMLRLQFEAEQADAVAESVALRSDILAERGIHIDELRDAAADEEPEVAPSAAPSDEPPAGEPATR